MPEYIWIKMSDIPEEIIEEYHLHKKVTEAGHACYRLYARKIFLRIVSDHMRFFSDKVL